MDLLVQIALLTAAAVGVISCLSLLPVAAPSFRRARRRLIDPAPHQLLETERLVAAASSSRLNAHAYLRPVLAEIADSRLTAHGWRLTTIPESAARQLLGDRLWELIAPGRPLPDDRNARGVSEAELAEMLDALQRL